LNLDAGQFTPLADSDVKKKAKGLGSLWGNPWFGRRDLIPPVSDARTILIDRAMVAHGLLTPEQLAEIHEVGQQMDKVRPDLALAREMADSAVSREKEEREVIKARKKAEAAEKKKQRAERIALRKQTDIVFLGRGVSGGLADRRANVEKLQRFQLPILASPADLGKALNLSIPRLRWLAFHSEASAVTHYVRFQVPKKSGGTRELSAPHHDLAACQQWILIHILQKIPAREPAHGFVPGRSTMTNATPHVARQVVLNLDLKDFFPSITFPRIKGLFQSLGFSPAVATILALLCTECPRRKVSYAGKTLHVATGPRGLPQGACTSPALSNLIGRRLDARLSGIATKLGWVYTRYADDLTLSAVGEATKSTAYLLARIRHIADAENFVVNEKKTRVQRPNTAQRVTGIVVNKHPNVPRKLARRMRAILHNAKKTGLAAQNRTDEPHFESWVGGMISYIRMVNPERGQKLRDALEKLA
jgi:retron-type reverse transcriptase